MKIPGINLNPTQSGKVSRPGVLATPPQELAPAPTDKLDLALGQTSTTAPSTGSAALETTSSELSQMVENIRGAEAKAERLMVEAQGVRAVGSSVGNNPTHLVMLGDTLEEHLGLSTTVASLDKAAAQIPASELQFDAFPHRMSGATVGEGYLFMGQGDVTSHSQQPGWAPQQPTLPQQQGWAPRQWSPQTGPT
jgi:hypothetical protein